MGRLAQAGRIGGLVGLAALAASGCDPLDCGPGTHRDGAECVANAPVACGSGTLLRDGRCELDPDSLPDGGTPLDCAPGTSPQGGQCVPDPVFYLACSGGETPAPSAGCEGMAPGEYCVTGTAFDIATGCAPDAEAGLAAILIDPIARLADPDGPPLGAVPLGPGGSFAIAASGNASRLVVIIDELDEGATDVWTRSLTGVRNTPPIAGDTYRLLTPASSGEDRAAWAAALGIDELLEGGYLVGRVLAEAGGTAVPAVGVGLMTNVQGLTDCDGGTCLRFFDDDPALTGFQPAGATTTGASGAFLVVHDGSGPLQLDVSVTGEDTGYPTLTTAVNTGSAFHMVLAPEP